MLKCALGRENRLSIRQTRGHATRMPSDVIVLFSNKTTHVCSAYVILILLFREHTSALKNIKEKKIEVHRSVAAE